MRVVRYLDDNDESRMVLVNEQYEIIKEAFMFSNYLYAKGYLPNTVIFYKIKY